MIEQTDFCAQMVDFCKPGWSHYYVLSSCPFITPIQLLVMLIRSVEKQ